MFRMQKLLLTLCCVALAQAAVPAPRINCQECIDEMHSLSWIVKNSANDIEVTFNPRPGPQSLSSIPVIPLSGVPEGQLLPDSA